MLLDEEVKILFHINETEDLLWGKNLTII